MLGKFESDPLLNVAGDAMTVTGATVTVKAESTGLNATLWQDEAGTAPLTNPFTVTGTTILFYASPADRYRVDIVKDTYSRTLRHEAVTMAALEGITNLSPAPALDGTEEFPVVVGGITKKSTIQKIIDFLLGRANIFTLMNHFTAGIGPSYIQNLGLTAAVATKALTIAIKTKALADASATDPVQIAFRNATLTTGDYVVRSATAATSVVVPSGGTLGFTAAEDGLIYIYAIDNAGTVELAVAKKALFDESIVHSTTAIGTGSDSDNVLYSTTARTNVAVRLIGRIRITTGAVAGEWDNAATRIEVGKVETSVDHFTHPVLKSGTAIATTSGTSHDFTGIPPGVKRITISLADVSTNGTSIILIQIGDSGGVEATGYLGTGSGITTAVGTTNYTTGFGIDNAQAATYVRQGSIILSLVDASTNLWAAFGVIGMSDSARTALTAGTKALSATLDRVRLTTVNGTDAFDAGTVNILYE